MSETFVNRDATQTVVPKLNFSAAYPEGEEGEGGNHDNDTFIRRDALDAQKFNEYERVLWNVCSFLGDVSSAEFGNNTVGAAIRNLFILVGAIGGGETPLNPFELLQMMGSNTGFILPDAKSDGIPFDTVTDTADNGEFELINASTAGGYNLIISPGKAMAGMTATTVFKTISTTQDDISSEIDEPIKQVVGTIATPDGGESYAISGTGTIQLNHGYITYDGMDGDHFVAGYGGEYLPIGMTAGTNDIYAPGDDVNGVPGRYYDVNLKTGTVHYYNMPSVTLAFYYEYYSYRKDLVYLLVNQPSATDVVFVAAGVPAPNFVDATVPYPSIVYPNSIPIYEIHINPWYSLTEIGVFDPTNQLSDVRDYVFGTEYSKVLDGAGIIDRRIFFDKRGEEAQTKGNGVIRGGEFRFKSNSWDIFVEAAEYTINGQKYTTDGQKVSIPSDMSGTTYLTADREKNLNITTPYPVIGAAPSGMIYGMPEPPENEVVIGTFNPDRSDAQEAYDANGLRHKAHAHEAPVEDYCVMKGLNWNASAIEPDIPGGSFSGPLLGNGSPVSGDVHLGDFYDAGQWYNWAHDYGTHIDDFSIELGWISGPTGVHRIEENTTLFHEFVMPANSYAPEVYFIYVDKNTFKLKARNIGALNYGCPELQVIELHEIPIMLLTVTTDDDNESYVIPLADLRRPLYGQKLRYTYGIVAGGDHPRDIDLKIVHNLDSSNYVFHMHNLTRRESATPETIYYTHPLILDKTKNTATARFYHNLNVPTHAYPVMIWVAIDATGFEGGEINGWGNVYHDSLSGTYIPLIEKEWIDGAQSLTCNQFQEPFMMAETSGSLHYLIEDGRFAVEGEDIPYDSPMIPEPTCKVSIIPDNYLESNAIKSATNVSHLEVHHQHRMIAPFIHYHAGLISGTTYYTGYASEYLADEQQDSRSFANNYVTAKPAGKHNHDFLIGILKPCIMPNFQIGDK